MRGAHEASKAEFDATGRWRRISLVLVSLGWLISAYLLLRLIVLHVPVRLGFGRGFCPGCDLALASPSAWQLGFPLAAWGLVYFAVTGLFIAIGNRFAVTAAWLGAAAGSGASLVLSASLFSSGASAVCLLCIAAHATNLALFASLSCVQAGQAPPHWLLPRSWSPAGVWVTLAAVAIVAGGVVEAGIYRLGTGGMTALSAYRSAPHHEIPADPGDPILGPADGTVRLIVFSSFQCPGCQAFARMMHHVSGRFQNQLTVVFKHFPLGKTCNPALAADLQPRACDAAWAAEAANRQRLFWSYHDGLFASSLQASEQILQTIAGQAGVELTRWDTDRRSASVQEKVRNDIELGWRLGVDGTPSVFLNGRRLSNLSPASLETLIQSEIDAASRRHEDQRQGN